MGSRCEVCGLRVRAGREPTPLISRLRLWHTTWHPRWKAYQDNGLKQDPNLQQLHRQR
jgi:hypothetical protein